MALLTLDPSQTALLIVDVQEKLFACVDRREEVSNSIHKVVKGFQILELPIFQSEQYPQGLGKTIAPLQVLLGNAYHPVNKTTFSCCDDPGFVNFVSSLPYRQWVIAGIEAHICVLQTVKGLLKLGNQVTVLNDAVTSRSMADYSTALVEMRDCGARISSVETVLFELLKDSKHPSFKSISHLVK